MHDQNLVSFFGLESTFVKAGDGETEEGLRTEEAAGESPGSALFGSLETL